MANLSIFYFFLLFSYCNFAVEGILRSLKPNEKYIINWEIVDDELVIELTVQTRGFIGFGLSYNGAMKDSDIVTVGVYPNGTNYLHDRYGIGEDLPKMDAHQDYTLIAASENATHTYAKFSRILNTCDDEDKPITGDTSRIIWSIGLTDEITYHGPGPDNRGVISSNFFEGTPPSPDLSPYLSWKMFSNKTMPTVHTTYWATFHKAPVLEEKHHIVGFDVYLEENSDAKLHTHHIDVFRCTPEEGIDADTFFSPYLGEGYDFDFHGSNPVYFPSEYCSLLAYSWSIGALITMFPDHVGMPIGGRTDSEYFMMIVHYDNPEEKVGVQFDTGMQYYYSNEIREYDGGFLSLGYSSNYNLMIPPNSVNFMIPSQCPGFCMDTMEHEIKIIRVLLHGHLSARKMRLRHFRNGKELPWIVSDMHYDFNFQQNLKLKEEIVLKGGDHLTTECIYDSNWLGTNEAIFGGESTRQEMCNAFLIYYPLLPQGESAGDKFVGCGSSLPNGKILEYFGITKIIPGKDPIVVEPKPWSGKTFSEIVNEHQWTDHERENYQNFLRNEQHQIYCQVRGFNSTYPEYDQDYQPESICNSSDLKSASIKNFMILSILSIFSISFFL